MRPLPGQPILTAATMRDAEEASGETVEALMERAGSALAGAIHEALVFSGLEAGALDVTFLADSDRLTADVQADAVLYQATLTGIDDTEVLG